MSTRLTTFKIKGPILKVWMIALILLAPMYAQLSEEVGRLIEAEGDVIILTNDGSLINAVKILESANEQGIPIKLGNKIITGEYSSAAIQTRDERFHRLQEMTSMQFGAVARPGDRKVFSLLRSVGFFFMRPSGKEGDYRTELVNTGWDDIQINSEQGSDGE